MAFNKIGALGYNNTLPTLAMSLSAGEVFLLPAGQGVVGTFNSSSNLALTGWTLNGQYIVELGKYCIIQYFDPVLLIWRSFGSAGATGSFTSDGTNYRIANLTGCPVGALITNTGSGMTNGFYGYNAAGSAVVIQSGTVTAGNSTLTVAASAGSSTWNVIVGGSINTTVTVTAGGTNYTRAPLLVFNPPVGQGSQPYVLPTGYCTLSSGAVNAVTVVNAGSGLVSAPTITVIPQPGDTTGGGAVLTVNSTLTNSGQVTWMAPSYNGTALTSTPTFTFTGTGTGSVAVTAIMNYTVTGATPTTVGVAYTSGITFSQVLGGNPVPGTVATGITDPYFDTGLLQTRPAQLTITTTATTLSGATISVLDAGYGFPTTPPLMYPLYQGVSTQGVVTPTVGGQTDTFKIISL